MRCEMVELSRPNAWVLCGLSWILCTLPACGGSSEDTDSGPPGEDAGITDAAPNDARVEAGMMDAASTDADADGGPLDGGPDDGARDAVSCSDADKTLFAPDCDGDGFGLADYPPEPTCTAPATPPDACDDPDDAEWVEGTTDCNDRNAEAYPGADTSGPDGVDCDAECTGTQHFDHDGDRVSSCLDVCADAPDVDSDGDGTLDCNDECPDDAAKVLTGLCGCGETEGTCAVAGIGAGAEHGCALISNGIVQCWGNGVAGQLGDGTATTQSAPVVVSGVSDAAEIAVGARHACARLASGRVVCWGENGRGELGDGTTTRRPIPVTVSDLTDAVQLAAGSSHTCARLSGGSVQCWGENRFGQLGDGTTTERHSPVPTSDLTDAVEVAAHGVHTCARLTDHTLRCWGRNNSGQLGDGTTIDRTTRVTVSGLTDAAGIAPGGGPAEGHTCARLGDGTVHCWGNNAQGQLGDGTTTNRTTAVAVAGLSMAEQIAAGGFFLEGHSCSLLSDDTVQCWGWNEDGQLGDGTTVDRSTPVTVSSLGTPVVAIAAGGRHTCAWVDEVTVECWGANASGQLGDGRRLDRSEPVVVDF